MKKRIISTLLLVAMLTSMLPTQLFATNTDAATPQCSCDVRCTADIANFACAICVKDYAKCTASATITNSFSDVSTSDWFYNAVQYVKQFGIFEGISSDAFSPYTTMTRAMFVTVLGRMAGVNTAEYTAVTFSDVAANSVYAPYIAWAAKNGISTGVGGGKFEPDAKVSREQMAVLMLNYFEKYKVTYESTQPITINPKDMDTISPWAQDAVLKMWRAGLLKGDAGNFNPKADSNRAEAAALCMRADMVVKVWRGPTKPVEKPDGDKDGDGGGTDGPEVPPVVQGKFKLSFNNQGGAALPVLSLAEGAKLENLPIPFKLEHTFVAWCKDQERNVPVTAEDTITQDMTLYAKYTNMAGISETATKPFVSAVDESPRFKIYIQDSSKAMSLNDVKAAIAYTCVSNPEYMDMEIVADGEKFVVSGKGGWPEGSTNKLELLNSNLTFGTAPGVRALPESLEEAASDNTATTYNFTIKKDDTLELTLSNTIKYIKSADIDNATQDGELVKRLSIPVAKVDAASGVVTNDETTGTFTYTKGTLEVGDSVAIYEGVSPDQRKINVEYTDSDVAYVSITAVSGSLYTYKKSDPIDVLFTPDVLPISDKADTDGNASNQSITVTKDKLTFTNDKYANTGLDATTTIDVGDFLVFYEEGKDPTVDGTIAQSYARITSVSMDDTNYTIAYETATEADITAAMDIYDTKDISGEEILGDTDVGALEKKIEKEAAESGFPEEAANYLTALALETDGFKNLAGDLSLKDYNMTTEDGKPVKLGDMQLMGSIVKVKNLELKAKIGTKLSHFNDISGLSAKLTVSFDVEIYKDGITDSKIIIRMSGEFDEQIRLSVNVSGGAVWKKAWIFPYIADYRLNTNIDVFNYTGINVRAQIGTFGFDEVVGTDHRWNDVGTELKELIEKAEGGKEPVGDMGTINENLSKKYSRMLENESDWVELISVQLFRMDSFVDPFHILCYGIGADFVVSANMNISLGFDFFYENAKRYNFSLGLFSKTSTNDTIVLVEEKYEFTFFVMGTIAVRAGVKLTVEVGLFSLKLDSIGITAEVGAYVKMWGYFYYRLTYSESKGRSTVSTGALLVEIGIYLEIKFRAQAFNGFFEYNPTIYEKEWPLWSAGNKENVLNFAYAQESAPVVQLRKKNYSTQIPSSVFSMLYMDLTNGAFRQKAYSDDKDFTITMSNEFFEYDVETNMVTVKETSAIEHKGEMTITWNTRPLSFSSEKMSRTIALDWQDPQGVFAISFDSLGGGMIPTIVDRHNNNISSQWPQDPVKIGYAFGGWQDVTSGSATMKVETMPNRDVKLKAIWTPEVDTEYTIEHYTQNLTNDKQYTLVGTVTKNDGTTDAVKTVSVDAITGFTAPAEQALKVLPDGSAVVKYYYTRNSYTATFERGEIGGEKVEGDSFIYTYKFGASINAPKMGTVGYTFDKWSPELNDIDAEGKPITITMGGKDITYTAQWTASTDTPYRVEHYFQNGTGSGYTLNTISNKSGTTNAEVKLADMVLENVVGMKYKDGKVGTAAEPVLTAKIDGKGTLAIKLYYTCDEYKVIYQVKNSTDFEVTYRYGALIKQPATPVLEGYTFAGWFSDAAMQTEYVFGGRMPAKNVDIYGGFIAQSGTKYVVEHYLDNAVTAVFELVSTQNKTGETGAALAVANLINAEYNKTGKYNYGYAMVGGERESTATIAADGNLVVKLYYTRETHTLTFNPGNGLAPSVITGKFESPVVKPKDPVATGYTWGGWKDTRGSVVAIPTVMPYANATYTGYWLKRTDYKYKVEYYKENAADAEYTIVTADTVNGTGAVNGNVTAPTKTYTSFTLNTEKSNATGAIVADESLVLKQYYDRVKFTITFDGNGGELTGEPTQSVKHGAAVTVKEPTRAGYAFDGWYDATTRFTGTMPAKNITVKAKWNAGAVNYTIKYYIRPTIDEENTDPDYVDTGSGKVGDVLTLANLKNKYRQIEKTGAITYLNAKVNGNISTTATIDAAGDLVVSLYYERAETILPWQYISGGRLIQMETEESSTVPYIDATQKYSERGYYDITAVPPTVVYPLGYEHKEWRIVIKGGALATGQIANFTTDKTAMGYVDIYGPKTYSIKYVLNGQEATITPSQYEFSNTPGMILPQSFEMPTHHKFMGWYEDEACITSPVTSVAAAQTGDKTFYGKTEEKSGKITYMVKGITDFRELTPDEIGDRPTTYSGVTGVGALKKIEYDNGEFHINDWFTDEYFGNPVPAIAIAAGTDGDVTFYCALRRNIITGIFDSNGGTGEMANQVLSHAGILREKTFEKAHYLFTLWNSERGGSGTKYADKAMFGLTNHAHGSSITFYAQWTPERYDIAYFGADTRGITHDNPAKHTIESDAIPLLPATDTSGKRIFRGWYTSYDYDTEVHEIPAHSTGAIRIYAKWEGIPCAIRLHPNGGTVEEEVVYREYDRAYKLPLPTKTGYFPSWYDNAELTGTPITDIKREDRWEGEKHFYAKWTLGSYNIAYEGLDVTASTSNNVRWYDYHETETIILKAPKYSASYNFSHWELDGKIVTEIPKSLGKNITLTAVGTVTVYTLTYMDGDTVLTETGNPTTYSINENLKFDLLPPADKESYTFAGWSLRKDPNAHRLTKKHVYEEDNFTYYAHYAKTDTDITYYASGGAFAAGGNHPTVRTGASQLLTVPTRDSTEMFMGWYDNPELTGAMITYVPKLGTDGSAESTKGMLLYAAWARKSAAPEGDIITIKSLADFEPYREGTNSKGKQFLIDGRISIPDNTVVFENFYGVMLKAGNYSIIRGNAKAKAEITGTTAFIRNNYGKISELKFEYSFGTLEEEAFGIIINNYGQIDKCGIMDVKVTNLSADANSYVGSIVGKNHKTGMISDCQVYGSPIPSGIKLEGKQGGGIVGSNSGLMKNCNIEGRMEFYVPMGKKYTFAAFDDGDCTTCTTSIGTMPKTPNWP